LASGWIRSHDPIADKMAILFETNVMKIFSAQIALFLDKNRRNFHIFSGRKKKHLQNPRAGSGFSPFFHLFSRALA
jgi:hypothetical protein